MSSPVASVPADAFFYLAIARMNRLHHRHLAIVHPENGTFVGLLDVRAILHRRATAALAIADQVAQAETAIDLAAAFKQMPALGRSLRAEGVAAHHVASVLSAVIRDMTGRAGEMAAAQMEKHDRGKAPSDWCLLVLGSGGRGESLGSRTHNTLDFFFELPDRTLDEEQFFAHVEAEVPEAAESLRKLLDRILKLCPELPYASNDRQLLATAVRALGVLDQTALPKIGVYGAHWDEEHASYFRRNLVPAVVGVHGWTAEVIAFALKAMLRDADMAEDVWHKLGMRAAVEQSVSPEAFAAEIASELKANPREESFRFGHYALLKLWESAIERSPWEEQLFAELDRLTPEYDYPSEA